MKRITVTLPDDIAATLVGLVAVCNESHEAREGATTHGKLTVASLLSMLAEDAAMVMRRPGSWEGANMAQVLQSHGYDV
ncbi:MAG: hypothetical protein AB1768_19945 [Pseudomonadota bacterium]